MKKLAITMAALTALILSSAVATTASARQAPGHAGWTTNVSADYFSRAYQESQGETLGNDF
jgi:hypothetical protein